MTLGKTPGIAMKAGISRESVAKTASALLAAEGVKNTWLDLLDGDEDIETAAQRVVREGVDTAEGEAIYEA